MEPGKLTFWGALQDATTALLKQLSISEHADYANAAEECQRIHHHVTFNPGKSEYASGLSCLPIIVLHRMASSMQNQIIQDFQRQLYKTCGICSLVLTAYEGEDNDLKI